MTDDIVERLDERIIADAFESRKIVDFTLAERVACERKEAAAEITRLRAENEKLRETLRSIIEIAEYHYPTQVEKDIIRAAFAAIREGERDD